jgi:hypothetical protein
MSMCTHQSKMEGRIKRPTQQHRALAPIRPKILQRARSPSQRIFVSATLSCTLNCPIIENVIVPSIRMVVDESGPQILTRSLIKVCIKTTQQCKLILCVKLPQQPRRDKHPHRNKVESTTTEPKGRKREARQRPPHQTSRNQPSANLLICDLDRSTPCARLGSWRPNPRSSLKSTPWAKTRQSIA